MYNGVVLKSRQLQFIRHREEKRGFGTAASKLLSSSASKHFMAIASEELLTTDLGNSTEGNGVHEGFSVVSA
jgi:hypothetical protein